MELFKQEMGLFFSDNLSDISQAYKSQLSGKSQANRRCISRVSQANQKHMSAKSAESQLYPSYISSIIRNIAGISQAFTHYIFAILMPLYRLNCTILYLFYTSNSFFTLSALNQIQNLIRLNTFLLVL